MSRSSGGRCLCIFVVKRSGQRRGRHSHTSNKHTQKHPQLCHPCPVWPTVCDLNTLQLRGPMNPSEGQVRAGDTGYISPAAFRTLITPILFVLVCQYDATVFTLLLFTTILWLRTSTAKHYSSKHCMYHSLWEDSIITDITAQQRAIYQSGRGQRTDHK